jgi:NADPH-dependent glutamate synthase beta subunit-like oxidoreductase
LNDTPFPGTLGRICPHPCESECTRGKKGDPICPKTLKRFLADTVDWDDIDISPRKSTGHTVAIVGSGPAGLSTAYDLALLGHKVTVFESLPTAGGMLAVGIPEFRLPKHILQKEIDWIKNMGVEILTNKKIESLHDIKDYDAIFLGLGAHVPQKLGVEGESLEGVIHATSFLKEINLGVPVKLGDSVAVVGGGNVAIDAVRTARRLGSKNAFIVYRRSIREMPAGEEEIEEAQEEGIIIHFLATPTRILGNEKVIGMECIKMELGEPDSSGRRRPIPIEGSEFVLNLDNVIPAISQTPDTSWIQNLEFTRWGTIVVNEKLTTRVNNVYAGGDVVRGPATVIEAIADGKNAAKYIDEYLKT